MNRLIRLGEGTYRWFDDRLGIGMIARATILHPVPRSVNWWYVFGSAVLTSFIFQVVTGIFLSFSYVPSPDHAYASLDWITRHQLVVCISSHCNSAGGILRGLHYWGASAMVLLIFVHTAAHFLTGSYKFPRELNWLSGAVLLMLTLVMAFTGQLLRWNQDAYWAIVVGAQQAARVPFIGSYLAQLLTAGPTVNGNTLTRIYGTHIWLVPGMMMGLIGMHLYLVIYKGISEWPVPGKPVDPKTYWAEYQEILHKDGEPFFPNALSRDAIFNLLVGAIVVALAVFVGAEALGPQADPASPANPRPDWYLIWYFALLALIPPASENYFILLFPLAAFLVLFLFPLANKGERHPLRRPWAIAGVAASAFGTAVLIFAGYAAHWAPVFTANAGIPAVPAAAVQNLSPPAVRGAQLMTREGCMACHAVQGSGGHRGPDLSQVGNRLSDDELTWRILRGGGGMPAYGNVMKPKDLHDLLTFLTNPKYERTQPLQAAPSG